MNTNETKLDMGKVSKDVPPYLSVSKIEKMVELVSSRNFPEINAQLFIDRGFGNADALLAVRALKFLNIVDDEGRPTELMSRIRLQGEARKKEFEKIIRASYKKLFDAVDAPQSLPSEELFNEFVSLYSLSHRVAKAALPAFIKLCEFAGLKEEGSIVGRNRSPKSPSQKGSSRPTQTPNKEEHASYMGLSPVKVADGRMILSMPNDLKDRLLDDENLSDDWGVIRSALRVFADKYIPKTESLDAGDGD